MIVAQGKAAALGKTPPHPTPALFPSGWRVTASPKPSRELTVAQPPVWSGDQSQNFKPRIARIARIKPIWKTSVSSVVKKASHVSVHTRSPWQLTWAARVRSGAPACPVVWGPGVNPLGYPIMRREHATCPTSPSLPT
jgi:hypothetical protein